MFNNVFLFLTQSQMWGWLMVIEHEDFKRVTMCKKGINLTKNTQHDAWSIIEVCFFLKNYQAYTGCCSFMVQLGLWRTRFQIWLQYHQSCHVMGKFVQNRRGLGHHQPPFP